MYEDDPQDIVFDVLGRAVYGEHPLGRPIIGRAPVIRDTPVEEIAAFHARRYVPGSIVIAAAGSVDHDADRRARHAARSELRRRRPPPPPLMPAPDTPRSTLQFQRKDTEQVHVCLGAHRAAAPRRPPLRAARARRHLRRAVLLAAVPGRARGARARLLRLLVHRPVHRHGRDRPLRRHAARQPRRRRWRSSPQELDRLRSEGVTEEELEAGARERQGAHRARPRVGRRAHEPPRRLGALRAAAARDRRDHGPHRRRQRSTTCARWSRSCGRPRRSRPPASAPTRPRSRTPSRGVCPAAEPLAA